MKSRNALFAALALGLGLTAPAFAQQTTAPTGAATPATPSTPATQPTQSTPATQPSQSTPTTQPTDPAAAQTTTAPTSPPASAPGADTRQVTWSGLDTDKDGKLNKAEVAPVQALTQVFDDADADRDGALTPDEYKAFVARNQAGAAQPQGGS